MKFVAVNPTPGDIFRKIAIWLKFHPKTRYLLLFAATCTVCYLLMNDVAWANTEDKVSQRTLFMPLGGVTDSAGVPIWRYFDLPMDPGNGPAYIQRSIRSTISGFMWAIYVGLVTLVIGLVEWIISFEWLSWIAAPFEVIATGVGGVLEAWMLIPLGVLASSVWIAIGYLRGRTGAATIEFAMVVIVFGIIVSPLVNPLSWMAGSGSDTASERGLIQRAAQAGSEAGGMAVSQDGEAQGLSLSGTIIDVTLRNPMLSMAFGSPLEGECASDWNQHAAFDSGLDTEEIRKEVIKCSDAVAEANQTDSAIWLQDLMLAVPTAIGVVGLLAVFVFFIILQVFMAMYNATLAIIKSYFALFPGNSRTAWLHSLFAVLVSVALIGIYVFAVTTYVWLMGEIMALVPPLLARVGAIVLGIFIIIAAITFWRMKRAGKNLSQALAEKMGRTGLSKNSTPKKPSNFGSTVKSAAATGMQMYQSSRMLRAAKIGVTAATAVGTAGVGAAAAKAGTTLASQAGIGAAAQAGTTASGALNPASHQGALPSPKAQGELPAGPDPAAQQHRALDAPKGPNNPEGAKALPPHVQGQVIPYAGTPHHAMQPAQTAAPNAGIAPHEPQQPRVNNIPEGNYGNSWVHKNGQVHSPMTIRPDGTPAKNIPSEDKINKAFHNGGTWITSENVKNLNPSKASATPTPMRARSTGEVPTQGGNK